MAKYRKKPIVIEAFQFDGTNGPGIVAWSYDPGDGPGMPAVFPGEDNLGPVLSVATAEGVMLARVGDWIIRGIKGEFYPCKPDIFDATYEPTDPCPS